MSLFFKTLERLPEHLRFLGRSAHIERPLATLKHPEIIDQREGKKHGEEAAAVFVPSPAPAKAQSIVMGPVELEIPDVDFSLKLKGGKIRISPELALRLADLGARVAPGIATSFANQMPAITQVVLRNAPGAGADFAKGLAGIAAGAASGLAKTDHDSKGVAGLAARFRSSAFEWTASALSGVAHAGEEKTK
jgi:hypothetical protein